MLITRLRYISTAVILLLMSCTPKEEEIRGVLNPEREPVLLESYFRENPEAPLPSPLGRGINLGDILEAPYEGRWGGGVAKEEYFSLIREAGFQTVRIPIRWSGHCLKQAPYTIQPKFSKRIETVVNWALDADLKVIIDVHHFKEILVDPQGKEDQLHSLWNQISELFPEAEYPVDRLYFELLNEPNDKLTPEIWNEMLPELVNKVREQQPNRVLIIGGADWNSIDGLLQLKLPENSAPVIATFHYYDPMWLTHQGAEWADPTEEWKDLRWMGDKEDIKIIQRDMDRAAKWSKKNGDIPLLLGEFGVYARKSPILDRANWTAVVAREAEKRGINWTSWEFCSGFSAYDRSRKEWREPLIQALIPGFTNTEE